MKNKFVWVTFRREGIHQFPAAATNPKFATGGKDDVSFLAHPHRHIFHFKVYISVEHDDRDLEFIQEKRFMESLYDDNGPLQLNNKSCEMMANDLYEQLAERYRGQNREIRIEVSEDGENGCLMVYSTTD